MAFDLNKNDGSASGGPSVKPKGSSKFDLSKNETAPLTVATSKSKTWIIGLISVLIIGGGIWYYSSNTTNAVHKVSTAAVPSDPGSTIVAETQSKAQAGKVVTDTAVAISTIGQDKQIAENVSDDKSAASLNHKIPVSFSQGSSKFSSVDQALIKRIISYLSENPAALIHVNGYASSEGPLAVNQTISQARADEFKKYLVSNHITESRIIAVGKGIENPIASNAGHAGRKKNRRVEIMLP
ncbi:OmpA family protein [Pedobacter cryoconitis]|uniref:OmpA family protein n=1 Tax=Pedobacter cryoconitis TaxID=188932 RepID=A0A327SZX0_9SPHI|nr:OmpA family protein [Pedobacter cryoconitis]RAJ33033.1 OmpA family protein [Pedobacter cryoconitis]